MNKWIPAGLALLMALPLFAQDKPNPDEVDLSKIKTVQNGEAKANAPETKIDQAFWARVQEQSGQDATVTASASLTIAKAFSERRPETFTGTVTITHEKGKADVSWTGSWWDELARLICTAGELPSGVKAGGKAEQLATEWEWLSLGFPTLPAETGDGWKVEILSRPPTKEQINYEGQLGDYELNAKGGVSELNPKMGPKTPRYFQLRYTPMNPDHAIAGILVSVRDEDLLVTEVEVQLANQNITRTTFSDHKRVVKEEKSQEPAKDQGAQEGSE